MIRFTFKKGIVYIELENRWELQRRLVTGKLQFQNEMGEIRNLEDSEVNKLWLDGKWVLDTNSIGLSKDIITLATPRDLSTFPEKWQKEAERRMHYIQKIQPDINKYNVELWRSLAHAAAEEINDDSPPSPSTVQEWWRRYRTTKSVMTLIPRSSRGGSSQKKGQYGVFEEVIAEIYLTPQQLPKIDVVNAIHDQIKKLNESRPDEIKIKAPSRATIYRWINELRQDLVDVARLGANAARMKYRIAMGGLKVDRALERIEIDNTSLDLIVYDKVNNLPLGRPWVTVAIDKGTKMIYSFYISFNASSSYSLLQCIKRGILPKDKLLARFPDIRGTWPVCGIPTLVAFDNGPDFHAEAAEKSCLEMGIQILYCPAAHPYLKGSIERFFRTNNQGLIHKLPGTTFSNIDQRGDYPAEDLAAIDMEDLIYLLTKWIVEIYHNEYHREIQTTPFLKWTELSQSTIIEFPAYPKSLDVITGIPAKRVLFHYGVELEGLHYNSKRLQEIRRHAGDNIPVQLKFHMESVLYIDVYDEREHEYFRVNCVNEDYCENLQRDSHRLIREHTRKKYNDHYSSNHLMESKLEIEAYIRNAITDKKMGKRKMGAAYSMLDCESVFNSENPILEKQKLVKSPEQKSPQELPDGLNDSLPQFDFSSIPSLDLSNDDEEQS